MALTSGTPTFGGQSFGQFQGGPPQGGRRPGLQRRRPAPPHPQFRAEPGAAGRLPRAHVALGLRRHRAGLGSHSAAPITSRSKPGLRSLSLSHTAIAWCACRPACTASLARGIVNNHRGSRRPGAVARRRWHGGEPSSIRPSFRGRFAHGLKHFNSELQHQLAVMQGQILGPRRHSRRDQEHEKFAHTGEASGKPRKVLSQFVAAANQHIPFLLRKAERIEDYLQQPLGPVMDSQFLSARVLRPDALRRPVRRPRQVPLQGPRRPAHRVHGGAAHPRLARPPA